MAIVTLTILNRAPVGRRIANRWSRRCPASACSHCAWSIASRTVRWNAEQDGQ